RGRRRRGTPRRAEPRRPGGPAGPSGCAMMAGMGDPIRIEDLHKSFGQAKALDGLDLSVIEGEVHGFLGPNGSGKSTTIRVLLGLLRPDSGRVSLLGGDPWGDAATLHRR